MALSHSELVDQSQISANKAFAIDPPQLLKEHDITYIWKTVMHIGRLGLQATKPYAHVIQSAILGLAPIV